jgi:hypothetical protein
MDPLSDGIGVDIEVRRRGSGYILIVHQFGVVVRSNDLKSGIEELERRLAIIREDFREVGIAPPSNHAAAAKDQPRTLDRIAPALIIIVTVASVLASFVFLATAPIVAALASVRSELSTLVSPDAGGGIANVGRRGLDFIVKLSQTLEQVTPQRREELRIAVRKIAREVDFILEDRKAAQPPSPQPPANGDRR